MQQQNILKPTEEHFTLSLQDRTIKGTLHLPGIKRPPFVITCHGLFSSMESDKFTAIAKTFTNAGMAAFRFDFSGCGKSSGKIADTTVSKRIEELKSVVCFAKTHPSLGKKFGIIGSSLGGFVSLFLLQNIRLRHCLSGQPHMTSLRSAKTYRGQSLKS